MVATTSNLPNGRKTYFGANGLPLSGGTVAFWLPGTSTPAAIWLDPQQNAAAPNPSVLDAAGSCVVFGIGQYREYVSDSLGNLVSDTIVIASTPLIISGAMLPVLQAPTIAAAEILLLSSIANTITTHLSINPGDQGLTVVPNANPPATLSSLNVQAPARVLNAREFLVNLGMSSNLGHGGLSGNDKVTLYCGFDGNVGTSNIWTLNTCLNVNTASGSYNAYGVEIDINNFSAHRGASGNLLLDFAAPVVKGCVITGAAPFTSTVGMAIESSVNGGNPLYARGYLSEGTFKVCAYQEWSTCPIAIQFDGVYSTAAINLTAVWGNAGAITKTALFMKNNQALVWQSGNGANIVTDNTDAFNNRTVGIGSGGVVLGANTIPLTTGLAFGTPLNRWGDTYSANFKMTNIGQLSWENGNLSGFVTDSVDVQNNRFVGMGSNAVLLGAATAVAPSVAGVAPSLGTATNYFSNLYLSGAVLAPSDVALKTDIAPLPPMLDRLLAIEPIEFRWKDKQVDEKRHYGFDADTVRDAFPDDFAGYAEQSDRKWLKKDELIGVLWKSVQELAAKVDRLTQLVTVPSK